jgi:glyoxylase-like metal-dependent hydrolase (beta-lactamase superfamily II)
MQLPWGGMTVRIIEHNAHAFGHAALLIEGARVLVAGDMLSDVFIPMLDLMGAADPIADYLGALDRFDELAQSVDVIVPGHGSIGDTAELRARINRDRAYLLALRDGQVIDDARVVSPKPGWEFVRSVHENQAARIAERNSWR